MQICQIYGTANLTLTPSPPFHLGKGVVQKCGSPWIRTGASRTTMHCSPMVSHLSVATRATISCPYETRYDVIGLHFPLLGFLGLGTVKVRIKNQICFHSLMDVFLNGLF